MACQGGGFEPKRQSRFEGSVNRPLSGDQVMTSEIFQAKNRYKWGATESRVIF